MASLRLKVQFGEDVERSPRHYQRDNSPPALRFVYVCDQPSTKTIEDLQRSLQSYICQQFSWNQLQLVQLTTNDRFLLCKSDRCSDVLKDNDHLICIAMEQFARENSASLDLDNLWLELKQHDDSDNTEKYLQVGLNDRSKLFVRMCGAGDVFALYLFSIHELLQIARDKRRGNSICFLSFLLDGEILPDNLIGRYEGQSSDDDWFVEARWSYDSVSSEHLALLCQLKVASSETIFSNKLNLNLDATKLQIGKGDLEILSASEDDGSTLTEERRARLNELQASIPPAKRAGPEIDLQRATSAKINRHECEGESSVRMACGNTNTILPYQSILSSEEKILRQEITLTHIIFSKKPTILPEILQQKRSAPAEKPISVTSLALFYQNHDGGWKECSDVMIAPVTVRNDQPRWLTDSVIHLEPDKLFSFLIRGSFSVRGDVGRDNSTRQRIHRSLPQPFRLKIVATDNFGKQSWLIIEHVNKPLQLETREQFIRQNQSSMKEMLAFLYADDCELEERIYLGIYIDKENNLVVKNSNSYYCSFERRAIRTFEYQARQNQKTEVSLDSLGYHAYSNDCKVFLLFDSVTKLFYAIRGELTTQTSKTEETIFVPIANLFGAA